MRAWPAFPLGALALGCFLYTSRPGFGPLLGAPAAELRLAPAAATERLAEALRGDSVPVSRIAPRDGYLETSWFDATTGAASRGSALGPGVVRVRGWVDPGRVGHSDLRVEVAYRALRDLSVPERELERAAPADHPVVVRVKGVLDSLEKRFGDPPPRPVVVDSQAAPPAMRGDEGPGDEGPPSPEPLRPGEAPPDSTHP